MTDIHGTPEPESICPGCDELEQEVQALVEVVANLKRAALNNARAYSERGKRLETALSRISWMKDKTEWGR